MSRGGGGSTVYSSGNNRTSPRQTTIYIGDRTLIELARATGKAKIGWTIWLANILANEGTHALQRHPRGMNDVQRCDAEHVSDTMSMKFLCKLADQAKNDKNPTLRACVRDNLGRGGKSKACVPGIEKMKAYMTEHRALFFEPHVGSKPTSWSAAYYGHGALDRSRLIPVIPDPTRARLHRGNTSFDYLAPRGRLVVDATVFTPGSGKVVLVVVWSSSRGATELAFYTDSNGDGIPETTLVSRPILLGSATGAPAPGDAVHVFQASNLAVGFFAGSGLVVLDRVHGALSYLPLSAAGLPAARGMSRLVTSQRLATTGGFVWIEGVRRSGTGRARIRMVRERPTLSSGGQAALWCDSNLTPGSGRLLAAPTTLVTMFKHFDNKLKAEWGKPEHATRIKRGKEYYRLIKVRQAKPKSFHSLMKRFIEADVDGFYSRMPLVSRIRAEVLGR